jgi:hypothetical protein
VRRKHMFLNLGLSVQQNWIIQTSPCPLPACLTLDTLITSFNDNCLICTMKRIAPISQSLLDLCAHTLQSSVLIITVVVIIYALPKFREIISMLLKVWHDMDFYSINRFSYFASQLDYICHSVIPV